MEHHYESVDPTPANYVPLTPISFLARTGDVFADREAHVYGDIRRTWSEVRDRCVALSDSLRKRGISAGDTVSVMAPNIPELHEAHFAVPMAGAVLNTINTRLEPATVAYILDHADSKLLIADAALAPLVRAAFELLGHDVPLVEIHDPNLPPVEGLGGETYDALISDGDPGASYDLPDSEWRAIALNYTSGTSGRPKGVVYHHRGAYLMSLGTVAGWAVPMQPTYLCVVPMFHCNGWNHPWAMTIVGARFVFVRDIDPARIYQAIRDEHVTHFGGAPIVLSMLTETEHAPDEPLSPPVKVMTAGAPPPPAILEKTSRVGFEVMQVYGLTETYGHISKCLWRDEWGDLDAAEQAELQAMQGVAFPMVEEIRVIDRETHTDVPRDGKTLGEIAIRGNTVMKGYYKDHAATVEAFDRGWFWSGDAAVMHPNGYVQIRDRLKDIIISGGENVSSVEVEAALHHHPCVQNVAVVAKPDEKWGEVPCAFVELRPGQTTTEADIIAFGRSRLAGFKSPKAVVFGDLPKTATGKVRKHILRDRIRSRSG